MLATQRTGFERSDSCEVELEAYERRLKENRLGDVSQESARRFVQQCLQQADSIEQGAGTSMTSTGSGSSI
jgi:hypothetical protein